MPRRRKKIQRRTAKKVLQAKAYKKMVSKKPGVLFPLKRPKGTFDVLPSEGRFRVIIKKNIEEIAIAYGYNPVELPIYERVEIFERGIGRNTDIVEKEMFTFLDKNGYKYALRPEMTASVCRAYIENGMHKRLQPVKFFTLGPVFRYERPQKGRYRQFNQFDLEVLGSANPIADAELIKVVLKIYESVGLENIILEINSIGCKECRPSYIKNLKDYYKINRKSLCNDCRRRLKANPLRLLDCKEDKCEQLANRAPSIIDNLCDECDTHFKKVLEYLDDIGIIYNLNTRLVRGLDYYTKTVFEIWPKGIFSSQNALGGGGRYDYLVEELGGEETGAVGFAGGIERIIEEMKRQQVEIKKEKIDVFLAQIGDLGKKRALKIYDELLEAGFNIKANFSKDSIKSQLKIADKGKLKWCLILGQKEAIDKTIIFRNMESGMQEVVDQDKMIKELKKRIKRFSL